MKHWTRYLNWQDVPTLWSVTILLGLTVLYVFVFFSVYPSIGPEIAAGVAIPVIAAGWFYGLRGGLLGALLLGVLLNTLLANLAGFEPGGWDVLVHTGGLPGTIAVMVIGAAIGSLSDIVNNLETQVEERTEALRQSKQQLSGILDSIEDAVWSISVDDYRLLYLSPGAERIYGRPVSAFFEDLNLWFRAVHPDDRKQVAGFRDTVLEKGSLHLEYRIVRPNGEIRWISNRASLIRDSSGTPVRFDGITHDITVRMQVEEELRRRREELSHVSRVAMMAELASSLAHELNQPLTAILTNAQVTRRLGTGTEADSTELDELLEDIVNDAKRAGKIIRRQRDFLRKGESETKPLDINELIVGVKAFAQADTLEHNVNLVLDLGTDLPITVGDRIQLEQVLLNLIRNGSEAMKDLKDDHRELVVQTSMGEPNSLMISVRAAGPPLDAKVFDQMFKSFHSTKPDGLGMGLSISRSIVRAHGGQLWATKNDDQGITMHFTLPCQERGSS